MMTNTDRPLSKKAQADEQKQEARTKLRELLPPGTMVHTVLRHCSRSGMMRSISTIIQSKEEPWDITYLVARACGWNMDQKNGGIKIGGAGMDMGFEIVYVLSRTLYPQGFDCIGYKPGDPFSKLCPSN